MHAMSPYVRRATTPSCSSLTGLNACSNALPFCCPSSTSCIPLTSSQNSVVCCPTGSDCTYIQPITCDVSLQNATAYPYNTLHTSQLDAVLPTCGSQCCPSGYECLDGICAMRKEVSSSPIATASSVSTTSSTGIAIPTNTAISIIVANATSLLTNDSDSSAYPPCAILVGVAAGIAVGIALSLLAVFLLRRHASNNNHTSFLSLRRKQAAPSPMFGGKTPQMVSSPIRQSNNDNHGALKRTDFLLSQTSSPAPLLGASVSADSRCLLDATPSPRTPLHQMAARRASGLPPVFPSPLRFGLPISSMPVPQSPRRLTGEMPATSGLSMGLMGRDGRGLTGTDNVLSRTRTMNGYARTNTAKPRDERSTTISRNADVSTSLSRQNSDDSYISTGSSTGMINVLMPPPVMFEREGREGVGSAETTWQSCPRVAGPSSAGATCGASTHTTMTMFMDTPRSRDGGRPDAGLQRGADLLAGPYTKGG